MRPAHAGPVSRPVSRVVALAAAVTLVVALPAPGLAQDPPFNRGIDDACDAEARGFLPFADVGEGPHEAAIGCAAYFGITLGRAADTYDPRAAVTREQMASFVARMMNRVDDFQLAEHPPRAFPDSTGEHRRNIDRLAAAGVVEGRDDGTYGRHTDVTREQMASYLARAIETITGEDLPEAHVFTDEGGISSAHRVTVAKLAAIGVTEGRNGGVFGPTMSITRQEMASFLMRGLDHLAAAGFASTPTMPAFPQAIGSFSTPLVPGQARNHNIHLAADIVDGQTIAPGETFSLNQGIGPRTRERGFQSNGFIDGDGEIISVVGGGVSQNATTFMNAAWFAGLPIVTHQPHSQFLDRYPPGREATIAWGGPELIVENDTPFPVTITSAHSSQHVAFTLIGTPWGAVTDEWISAPAGVVSGQAFTAEYGRTVTYPDGSSSSESHAHTYEAAPG